MAVVQGRSSEEGGVNSRIAYHPDKIMSSGNAGNSKSAAEPVKWTLVEAVADTPQRKGKKGMKGARQGGRGSSAVDNWRQPRGGSGAGGGRGGGGGGAGSSRNNQRGRGRGHGHGRSYGSQGRGRDYGAYVGGATYYPRSFGAEVVDEEHKAYMTSMAVKQIEFYFTVENLCKDIFIRSYMDEEGYIPIAFVANFPGVARFGVDLADITAGILASDTLQVDTENETMRMREDWEVWLLPNQATGTRGVPRYIKIDPATVSEEAAGTSSVDAIEPGTILEQATQSSSEESANDVSNSDQAKVCSIEAASEEEPAVQEEHQSISASAPAWTPGGVATNVVEVQVSPIAVLPDDTAQATAQTAASKKQTQDEGEKVGDSGSSVTADGPVAELHP